jgi:hypothetical protein
VEQPLVQYDVTKGDGPAVSYVGMAHICSVLFALTNLVHLNSSQQGGYPCHVCRAGGAVPKHLGNLVQDRLGQFLHLALSFLDQTSLSQHHLTSVLDRETLEAAQSTSIGNSSCYEQSLILIK